MTAQPAFPSAEEREKGRAGGTGRGDSGGERPTFEEK